MAWRAGSRQTDGGRDGRAGTRTLLGLRSVTTSCEQASALKSRSAISSAVDRVTCECQALWSPQISSLISKHLNFGGDTDIIVAMIKWSSRNAFVC